jgi:hypothetical protein
VYDCETSDTEIKLSVRLRPGRSQRVPQLLTPSDLPPDSSALSRR